MTVPYLIKDSLFFHYKSIVVHAYKVIISCLDRNCSRSAALIMLSQCANENSSALLKEKVTEILFAQMRKKKLRKKSFIQKLW